MIGEISTPKMFEYGSTWLRADFHLHTKEDKEFQFAGVDNEFVNLYIEKLKSENIQIGLITNHNKFSPGLSSKIYLSILLC